MTMKDITNAFKKIIPGYTTGRIFLNHETGIISTEFQGRQYCLDMQDLKEVDSNCVAIAEYNGVVEDAKNQIDCFCKSPVNFTDKEKQQIIEHKER